ncbi:MAG: rhodanese-like domain-containing protein [Thermoleophilia bacterium]|nr:rhodanese-like domain-containing protein [Thermoleophilia bacterium]
MRFNLFGGKSRTDRSACRHIGSPEAMGLMRRQDALLIDVREPHEFASSRIPDARHIPLRQITHEIESLRQHGDRPIILSCHSGRRSEMVCRLLKKHGFDNLYNLAGGIRAWRRANLPVSD